MRRDFLRVIFGAPGEIHLSQIMSESVCHFVRQPFLNDEFLHALTNERGYGASLRSAAEILAKNRLARGFRFNEIVFGANMEGECPANLDQVTDNFFVDDAINASPVNSGNREEANMVHQFGLKMAPGNCAGKGTFCFFWRPNLASQRFGRDLKFP